MDDSSIPDFIDRFLPEVIDKASQLNPQAGQVGQIIAAIAKPSWQHPTAFFFSGVEAVQGRPPVPHLGIIWQPVRMPMRWQGNSNSLSVRPRFRSR